MKSHLKQAIIEKRNSLTKKDILERSALIEGKLGSIEKYHNSKVVMFYVSFGSEVYTHNLIKFLIGKKTVVVPKIVSRKMEPSIIIDFDSMMVSHPFGILEPIDLAKISYKNIEVVIVPGIVFDMKGYRLGYGYGFYDSFLKNAPKALKIGLAFDFQVVDEVPREGHDIPVDYIVTEERVIKCQKS